MQQDTADHLERPVRQLLQYSDMRYGYGRCDYGKFRFMWLQQVQFKQCAIRYFDWKAQDIFLIIYSFNWII